MENYRIVDLDPADPITVSYKEKIGNEPTGKENPELLKLNYSHGHDATIINGVSRIGWMTGGKKARWVDEDMADVFTGRAVNFIEKNAKNPFFLYFATQDIHVPRVPHSRFVGKSGMGARGDAILQLDWSVGEVLKTLDRLKITDNTLLIFTSDNGAVVDDGYEDRAVELLNGHTPSGILRGGKYSAFEGGTKIPMLVSWPAKIKSGTVSNALFSQIDIYASLAALIGRKINAQDSRNSLSTLLGGKINREFVIQQAVNSTLGIIQGDWKYISPGPGPAINPLVNIELGNNMKPQLYHLKNDGGETKNLAEQNPEIKARNYFSSTSRFSLTRITGGLTHGFWRPGNPDFVTCLDKIPNGTSYLDSNGLVPNVLSLINQVINAPTSLEPDLFDDGCLDVPQELRLQRNAF
jgi:arylsulfatase A-like enzyme